MSNRDDDKRHPAFGLIEVSRVSSNQSTPLFGSAIGHPEHIQIRLHTAYAYESQGSERYMQDKVVAEFRMSYAQFARMITTPNSGMGTPVTLTFLQHEGYVEPLTEASNSRGRRRRAFEKSFTRWRDDLAAHVEAFKARLSEGRLPTKAQAEEALATLTLARDQLAGNAGFAVEQFERESEEIVAEAVADIEAFVDLTVQRTGLQAIAEGKHLMLGDAAPTLSPLPPSND